MEGSPFQQTHFKAHGRVLFMCATPALAVAILATYAVCKHDRIYELGPVSTAHAFIGDECWRCHTENGLVTATWKSLCDDVPVVPDKACTVCHAGPPHHAGHKQHGPAACADCHLEHRGQQQLAAIDDRHCVACHADLNATHRQQATFASGIHSFADHPEFALFDTRRIDSIGATHRVRGVAVVNNGRWQDTAKIRLNHAVHLNPKGILGLDGKRHKLDCRACHTPDAAGYMQPINYERHCAECHRDKLNFDSQRFADVSVPHGDAEAARGVIRQRYVEYYLAHPKLHAAAEAPDAASEQKEMEKRDEGPVSLDRTIPGKPPRLPQRGWTWVNEQVENAERALFLQRQDGCRYCHTKVEPAGQTWRVEPPRIPYRWYLHARFRHDRHRMLTCTACHTQAETSQNTTDVLLPSITICRTCHINSTAQPQAGAARAHCALCHDYHRHQGENFDGPMSLELQIVKPDNARKPPSDSTADQSAQNQPAASSAEDH